MKSNCNPSEAEKKSRYDIYSIYKDKIIKAIKILII